MFLAEEKIQTPVDHYGIPIRLVYVEGFRSHSLLKVKTVNPYGRYVKLYMWRD